MLLFQASKSSPSNRKIKISLPLLVSFFGSMFTKKMRECVTETPLKDWSLDFMQYPPIMWFVYFSPHHAETRYVHFDLGHLGTYSRFNFVFYKVCYPFTMANLRSLPCNENLTSSSSESKDGFVPNEDCDLSPPASIETETTLSANFQAICAIRQHTSGRRTL